MDVINDNLHPLPESSSSNGATKQYYITTKVEWVTLRYLNQTKAARPMKIKSIRSKVMMSPLEPLGFLFGKRNTVTSGVLVQGNEDKNKAHLFGQVITCTLEQGRKKN